MGDFSKGRRKVRFRLAVGYERPEPTLEPGDKPRDFQGSGFGDGSCFVKKFNFICVKIQKNSILNSFNL
ncbi:MAG: hypothetical protein LBS60_05170 [Deltaproteobacteria bacterium]|nr:hypothetical protein [Deltaproteobacteria bacterium]